MRVIVAGATGWTDEAAIRRELAGLPPGSVVIHGDCAGADEIAGRVAAELGLSVEPMRKEPPDFARHGRDAWKGLNERMLAAGAVLVLGFHQGPEPGAGTRHLVELARAAGVEVRLFRPNSPLSP